MKKKKVLFIAVVAIATLASCTKDRTCTCTRTETDTAPGATVQPASTTITTGKKLKKSDATLWCQSSVETNPYTSGTSTYTRTYTNTCELK